MVDNFILNIDINISEFVDELKLYWKQNKKFNLNAFDKSKITGNDLMCCCPFHEEDKPSFGITLNYPYIYNCFSCGVSGDIIDLIMYVKDCSFTEAVKFLTSNYVLVSKEKRKHIDLNKILDKDTNTRRITEEELQEYKKKKHIYINQRGITDKTLIKFEVGYDEKTNSIVFPVRDSKGNVRFLQRREVIRKIFLNESDINKKDIVYGLYYLLTANRKFNEIFLVESIIDCLSLYESKLPAGALMGCNLFKEQVYDLMKAGIKTVNLMLDNDRAGKEGSERAYELITKLSPIKVNIVIYPEGNYKDANDLLLAGKINEIKIIPFEHYKFLRGSFNGVYY